MANRSHLYTFDRFEAGKPEKPRGLHEWSGVIPLSHLLLMSARPRAYASSIFSEKVAIVGDAEAGIARFLAFMRALAATQALGEEFAAEVEAAAEFLGRDEAKGRFLLLEPGEVFALATKPAVEQNAQVVEQKIPKLAVQVDALLTKPPEKLFAKAPRWLAQIKTDWNKADLGLGGWSTTLYYALDT